MGVWLQPRPEVYAPIWRDDDIAPHTLRVLLLEGTVRMVPTTNALNTAALHTARADWFTGRARSTGSRASSTPVAG